MILFSGVITLYVTRYNVLVYSRTGNESYYNIAVNDMATRLYLQDGTTWKAEGISAELANRIGSYLPPLPVSMHTPVPAGAPIQKEF